MSVGDFDRKKKGENVLFGLSVSEWLLYGGLAVMAAAVTASIVCVFVFRAAGKKIKRVLEREYGAK